MKFLYTILALSAVVYGAFWAGEKVGAADQKAADQASYQKAVDESVAANRVKQEALQQQYNKLSTEASDAALRAEKEQRAKDHEIAKIKASIKPTDDYYCELLYNAAARTDSMPNSPDRLKPVGPGDCASVIRNSAENEIALSLRVNNLVKIIRNAPGLVAN